MKSHKLVAIGILALAGGLSAETAQQAFEKEKSKCASPKLVQAAAKLAGQLQDWNAALQYLDICISNPAEANDIAHGLERIMYQRAHQPDLSRHIDGMQDAEVREMARFAYRRYLRASAQPAEPSGYQKASLREIYDKLKKAITEPGTAFIKKQQIARANVELRSIETSFLERPQEDSEFERKFQCLLKRPEISGEDRNLLIDLRECARYLRNMPQSGGEGTYFDGFLFPDDPCKPATQWDNQIPGGFQKNLRRMHQSCRSANPGR